MGCHEGLICQGSVISSQNGAQADKEAYRDPGLFKTLCQLGSTSPEPQRCHWHSLSVSNNIKFLLSNRLNQDCIENLFALIRSKGGHRSNPDPQEFRYALRQVMVDKVLSSIRGTNCKEDLDTFLLNFMSPTSTQTQSLQPLPAIRQQLQVQAQVVNLVKSAKAEGIVQLENVIVYI